VGTLSVSTSAKLVSYTQPIEDSGCKTPEELIAYCAKVSNPEGQDDLTKASKLLKYCKDNAHWSVFEMADATVEIEAPRDISRQLLRHRSFCFQEFSQRYSSQISFAKREVRSQDHKNRQNSIDDLDDNIKSFYNVLFNSTVRDAQYRYEGALADGVAKECARVLLPEGLTMSRLYMKGSLRSWLHYLDVREGNGTQLEHIRLANQIREVITPVFPTVLGLEVE
jgi:thymidylate synthase (FAD)